jgi:DNA-binding NarL/FixJ family response regulator
VAGLVAGGLTNPQIAARLGVTAGTVKDHISSALRKLGVRSRAELAAAVAGNTAI